MGGKKKKIASLPPSPRPSSRLRDVLHLQDDSEKAEHIPSASRVFKGRWKFYLQRNGMEPLFSFLPSEEIAKGSAVRCVKCRDVLRCFLVYLLTRWLQAVWNIYVLKWWIFLLFIFWLLQKSFMNISGLQAASQCWSRQAFSACSVLQSNSYVCVHVFACISLGNLFGWCVSVFSLQSLVRGCHQSALVLALISCWLWKGSESRFTHVFV